VFVTGGTGFVGSHVVEALLQRGHAVACLVRDPRKAESVFGARAPAVVLGDLGDPGALECGCAEADAVVHLAGLTAARSRAEFFAANVEGTRAVADAVRAAGVRVRRFVSVSSLAAAGPASHGTFAHTGDEASPISDYGRSKLDGEAPVRALALAWTILRPPAVYGPRDTEFLRLFRIARRGFAPVFGDGSQRLSMIFASDLAEAIVRCLEVASAPGTYYPAHRETTTTRALLASIAAALDVSVRIVPIPRSVVRPLLWINDRAARLSGRATLLAPDKAGDLLAAAWTCSPAPLEARVDWRASVTLADGLRRTADWYRAAGWL
jgi:nucleoside-diphosphate-sugar epimerase